LSLFQTGQMLTLGGYLPQSRFLSEAAAASGAGQGDWREQQRLDLWAVATGLAEGGDAAASRHHVLLVEQCLARCGASEPPLDVEATLGAARRLEAAERLTRLYGAAELLMSDVREDISSVPRILGMFATLRAQHPAQYRAAFVSMSLPPILGELVRLDMVAAPLPFKSVSHLIYPILDCICHMMSFFLLFPCPVLYV
jgi:hypothetical protein